MHRLRLYAVAGFCTLSLVVAEESGMMKSPDNAPFWNEVEFVKTDESQSWTPLTFAAEPNSIQERSAAWLVKEAVFINRAHGGCFLNVLLDNQPISTVELAEGKSAALKLPIALPRTEIRRRLQVTVSNSTSEANPNIPLSQPGAGRLVFDIEETGTSVRNANS